MALALGIPLALRLGALSVFGRDRFVLVRAVLATRGCCAGRPRSGTSWERTPTCRTCGRVTGCRT